MISVFVHLRTAYIILLVTGIFQVVSAQRIPPTLYRIDTTNRIILCTKLPVASATRPLSVTLDQVYTFPDSIGTLTKGIFYSVDRTGAAYSLMFSSFPFIDVDTRSQSITPAPAVITRLTITDTTGISRRNWASVNVRGAYTSTLPKKPYRFILCTDSTGTTTKDTSLFGMRTDSEWLLLAMYNEPLRINNAMSHALWLKMYKPYYIGQEPDAVPGIHTRYVDVFLNGTYNGIYLFTEPMDRKQLKLKKTKTNGGVRGELYKSTDWTDATLFAGLPVNNGTRSAWAGYELKYPNDTTFWSNLYTLVDFVVNSTDSQFKSKLSSRWQIDNLVDYFLFLNLIRAGDNRGKNLYIARYKEDDPYLYIPWDLDGTFGYMWAGYRDEVSNDILSNGLYNKLLRVNPAMFKEKTKKRWFALRTSQFDAATLKNSLSTNVQQLQTEGAYRREAQLWPVPAVEEEVSYARQWLDKRLTFLDDYFSGFPDSCASPVAPTLTASLIIMKLGQSVTLTADKCPYTTVWNNGATGNTLLVSPAVSSVFSATCVQTSAVACQSPSSAPLSISVLPADSTVVVADLSIRQYTNRAVASVNQPVAVTVALTNDGPAVARTVRLQNRLPENLIPASTPEGRRLSGNVSQLIEFSTDSIDVGQTLLFTYELLPTQAGQFRNSVQVIASSTLDPDSQPGGGTGDGEDDMSSIGIRTNELGSYVSESPNSYQRILPTVRSSQPTPDSTTTDLSLNLSTTYLLTRLGGQLILTLEIRNQGGLTATGVIAGLQLPAGLSFISSTDFTLTNSQLISDSLTVGINQQRQLSCVVQATEVGSGTIIAQVLAADKPDADSVPGQYNTGEDDEDKLLIRIIRN